MNRKSWSNSTMKELLEYIEQDHRKIKEKLQKLQTLIEQAASQQKRKDQHSSTIGPLKKFYSVFKTKIENHFEKEEQILIPYIRKMDESSSNPDARHDFPSSSIKNPISQIEYDHDQTEHVMFAELSTITTNYKLPEKAGDALKALYEGLKDIEIDIRKHINLENKILFPWAIELELQLIHKR
jgi:regulator of cell morphogenesis and NO signaling